MTNRDGSREISLAALFHVLEEEDDVRGDDTVRTRILGARRSFYIGLPTRIRAGQQTWRAT